MLLDNIFVLVLILLLREKSVFFIPEKPTLKNKVIKKYKKVSWLKRGAFYINKE